MNASPRLRIRENSDSEGDEDLDGLQFNQTYMIWWIRVRLDSLILYGLDWLAETTEGEAKEEEEE